MSRNRESLILNATRSTPSFPRLSGLLLRKFCIDVSLVSFGIRTAYLLDICSLSETTACHLVEALRQSDSIFKDLLLLVHYESEQLFFVNLLLLCDRLLEARSGSPWTSFVYLGPEPRHPQDTPQEILTACQTILDTSAQASTSFDISVSSLTSSQMIALAGFLLEYPVSYFPIDSDQGTFLHGVPLHVFECWLVLREDAHIEKHSFMKFSCPSECLSADEREGALAERIQRRFESRLGAETDWRVVKVTCETRTLDRVAL